MPLRALNELCATFYRSFGQGPTQLVVPRSVFLQLAEREMGATQRMSPSPGFEQLIWQFGGGQVHIVPEDRAGRNQAAIPGDLQTAPDSWDYGVEGLSR